jgi:hypothetical protein
MNSAREFSDWSSSQRPVQPALHPFVEASGAAPLVELEIVRVIDTPAATPSRYRVRR